MILNYLICGMMKLHQDIIIDASWSTGKIW